MGELILCNQEIAAMPYYLENISCNVYSLEELCYCIGQNLYLIDRDFMNRELCVWIEKELGEKQLADRLENRMKEGSDLADFVEEILRECCYLEENEIQRILTVLKEMQNKSVFECGKIRADRLTENKKYVHAILEYRQLLQMEADCKSQPVLCGNIWHNMGTAFARLFLFHEAAECFLEAYTRNQNHESLVACMAAYKCGGEPEQMDVIADKYGIAAEEREEISNYWKQISRGEAILAFEQEVDELFAENGDAPEENVRLMELIRNWKKEYNRNGRM